MSAEARVPTPKGWTTDTALDHILAIIASNDRRYEERFAASQKALDIGLAGTKNEITVALAAQDRAVQKAEAATEKRFESVNEFRGTLDNQQRTLIPRSEVDVLVRGLNEKIAQLTKQMDAMTSERKGGQQMWAVIVAGVMTLIALGSLALRVGGL
jgi:hypothetical protein